MQRRAVLVAGLLLACRGEPTVSTIGTAPAAGYATIIDDAIVEAFGPACALPPRSCRGPRAYCHALVRFAPARGPGYEDTPLDDERTRARSSSYLRRDLVMLVKYAAARVHCEAAAWPGRHGPLALGDMSQRSGEIPGTWRGRPRHPPGSHEHGRSLDVAYYQTEPDNALRSICPHEVGGVDHFHCTAPPTTLDALRTALFIGALFEEPMVRVVGVDGRAAPPILDAIRRLCRAHRLRAAACRAVHVAFEDDDTGLGWYFMHHHHLHVSVY